MKVKEGLLGTVIDNPMFSQFKDQEQLQEIFTKLRSIREQDVTENE